MLPLPGSECLPLAVVFMVMVLSRHMALEACFRPLSKHMFEPLPCGLSTSGADMRRREFLSFLGGAAAWPVPAWSQQAGEKKRVGALMGIAEGDPEGQAWVAAFKRTLEGLGWSEGRNIQMVVRWPGGDINRMREHAVELVQERCDVILTHATPATAALRAATRTIPNVFAVVVDPVSSGFVASLNHPGGNTTGFTNYEPSVGGKWLELLKEIAPALNRIAILLNPDTSPGGLHSALVQSIERAATEKGITVLPLPFRSPSEIERGVDGLHGDQRDGV